MRIHIVAHTHWDREWYRTYEEFFIFLADHLADLLSHQDEHPDKRSFLLC